MAAKLGISHALSIPLKIVCLGANLLCDFGIIGLDRTEYANELFDFPAIEQTLLVDLHPGFLFSFFIGVQLASDFPQMLARVVEIDDLNGARKVQLGNIPGRVEVWRRVP
ncbi:MAG TPA: hypothetical protein VND42_00050 [Candidatus Acidoferrales bacterium]|nr:hypothetical protein [Candidatus Acidoferrales bacterium]